MTRSQARRDRRRTETPTRRRLRQGGWVTAISSAIVVTFVAAAGYFDGDPVHVYPAVGARRTDLAVVNFSGDMGLRFLLGASTSRGLTEHGITTVGITTPALFGARRTRAEVDAIVADNIRIALARSGAARIVVMGQSYGADIVQTGLAHLPADLRARVAGIVLILPGNTVFFRADPMGIVYRGTPDIAGAAEADTLTWAPLTCIYGIEEDDSLCPLLHVPGAHLVAMPGSHTIRHDAAGLLNHVLAAIRRVAAPPRPIPDRPAPPRPV